MTQTPTRLTLLSLACGRTVTSCIETAAPPKPRFLSHRQGRRGRGSPLPSFGQFPLSQGHEHRRAPACVTSESYRTTLSRSTLGKGLRDPSALWSLTSNIKGSAVSSSSSSSIAGDGPEQTSSDHIKTAQHSAAQHIFRLDYCSAQKINDTGPSLLGRQSHLPPSLVPRSHRLETRCRQAEKTIHWLQIQQKIVVVDTSQDRNRRYRLISSPLRRRRSHSSGGSL